MSYPNTLIFVDFPSDDPAASGKFYAEVFGWTVEPRPEGVFHRIVPGQNFQIDDKGTQGPTGNLHMGIFNVNNARPHPDPALAEPRDQLAVALGERGIVPSEPGAVAGDEQLVVPGELDERARPVEEDGLDHSRLG